jgi:DNA-binding IclR family transcriptional regulator
MASNSSFNFVEFIRPYITELSRVEGETVDVSEMQKSRTVFVDQVVGSARLNIVSKIGEAFPLHCLASRKAMLSTLTETALNKRMARKPLEKHTPFTITDYKELEAELVKVRKTHIAFDIEEHFEGVSAIGTSIQEPGGTLYAISIPVPSVRFKRKKKRLVEALLECRARILAEIEL